jgi:glyoxylate reductase
MKPTIVITGAIPPVATSILSNDFQVVEHPPEGPRTEDELITMLAEADGAITRLTDPITRRVLASNPTLQIVANYAVGYNNIDVAAARELGIVITNTPGVLTETTADLAFGLILAVMRWLVKADRDLRAHGRVYWNPNGWLGQSLTGKTLGIIGMGRIGSAVAMRAVGFGMNIVYTRRGEGGEPASAGRRLPLEELLATSDIISIHCPLTEETRHLIDQRALDLMKPSAYLINTARGAIVDERALASALAANRIAGAGLDVYEEEPAVTPELFALDNVVLLPHIGSATIETRAAMARLAAQGIVEFFRGQIPANAV